MQAATRYACHLSCTLPISVYLCSLDLWYLQLIVELYHNADDLEITDAQLDKLSASLLDGRVQALLAGVLGSSRCVPLLRSTLGLACVLMVEQPWFIFG